MTASLPGFEPLRSLEIGDVDRVLTPDVVVVGSGAAGLTVALGAAPRRVVVITAGALGKAGSSAWAQGGIAAALGPDDRPELHAEDTVVAGAGLTDPEMATRLTSGAAEGIGRLLALGARFDHDDAGRLSLGREAAHGRRRILHASGDATGAEVMRVLTRAAGDPATGALSPDGTDAAEHISPLEFHHAVELVVDGRSPRRRVCGVLAEDAAGRRTLVLARAVVLATGGLGAAYRYTTNPPAVRGDGLALAARVGADLVDVEFVQFHPTALLVPAEGSLPLLTEALRGEGAILVNDLGERFMVEIHPDAELAPRDVVARGIHAQREAGREVYLDAREAVGERFPERFPTVFASCMRFGIDPRVEPMPVTPAAHYHMGGIAVDSAGRSSLPGLYAVGEAASTGVHGANRLASNSLLEALVMGGETADELRRLPTLTAVPDQLLVAGRPGGEPETPDPAAEDALRRLLWEKVGLVRDAAGLTEALERIDAWDRADDGAARPRRGSLLVARLVTTAALAREESRGGHFRSDFPEADPAWARRLHLRRGSEGGLLIEPGPLVDAAPARRERETRP